MILQALTDYYDALSTQGKIAKPGWSKVKVSWALEINEKGQLLNIHPLRIPSEDGKKTMPREMVLPLQPKRSGKGAPSYYLCDNTKYFFGIEEDKETKKCVITEKSKNAFQSFRNLHQKKLSNIDNDMARGIVAFLNRYNPEDFLKMDVVLNSPSLLYGSENCVFMSSSGSFAHMIPAIAKTVKEEEKSDAIYGTCMITGERAEIARIHNSIKGLKGNSPNGWTLVCFDKDSPAYDSFGKKQGYNAPISKYAAFAYTSALNYLTADRNHVKLIGNTTVVYWAKDAQPQYQDIFAALLDGAEDEITDDMLNGLMEAVASGKDYDFEGIPIKPQNDFYILGISPNAARLSVRFFYHNSFGNIVKNLKKHYADIQIISDNRSKWKITPLWSLLLETVNQKSNDNKSEKSEDKKTPLPKLSGDVLKSMMTGSRYPDMLINQTILRIRAEHDVTRGRAAIIKAYLLRNTDTLPMSESLKEVAAVSLQQDSNYTPYVLGRLFSVLEGLQQSANPGINATIKDRFFNSACTTPAAVFPLLLRLSNSHLKKLNPGNAVFWNKQIGELTEKMEGSFPTHLSLQEQGAFILGYYHQTQKRFEKKNNTEEE